MPQLTFQSTTINTINRICWDLFYTQTNIDLDVTLPIHVEIRFVTSVNKIIIRRQYDTKPVKGRHEKISFKELNKATIYMKCTAKIVI